MERICITIVCIFLLISCDTSQKGIIEVIDLTNGLKHTRKVNLSEIASDVEYIILDTTEESYIGSFEQVKFFKDFIFILDSKFKAIHIFNKNGKLISKIDKKGRGPGEYIGLRDLEIYPKDTSIFILDGQMDKLINYSINGEFIHEWRILDRYASAFSILEGPSYIFFTTYPNNAFNDGFSLSVYDKNLHIVNRLINKDILSQDIAFSMPSSSSFTFENFCDTLTYWEYRKDVVYKITNGGTVIPKYKITYPNPMPLNADITNNYPYNVLYSFIETDCYMFFFGNYKEYPFRSVYSKKTKEAVTLSLNYADELNYGFINDIDGGYTFFPDGVTPDGKLYCTFSMFELKRFLSESSNINKNVLSEQKRTELLNLVEKSKLEDNYCLMIVTLK